MRNICAGTFGSEEHLTLFAGLTPCYTVCNVREDNVHLLNRVQAWSDQDEMTCLVDTVVSFIWVEKVTRKKKVKLEHLIEHLLTTSV